VNVNSANEIKREQKKQAGRELRPKPCSTRLQYPDFTPISAVVPAFTGYFLLKIFWTAIAVVSHVVSKAPIRAYFNL
jgi:hypothetical protein